MKILKLFISLSLILSVSLINSLAAISVSDGSAFVTKAEFAADLNNLSNRMSSLENSLDAKIDSLVSSYLSRNGIWNGEKQTFLDYTEEKIWANKYCTKDVDNETVENAYIKVFTASKSGLANLSFSLTGRNSYSAVDSNHCSLCMFKSAASISVGVKGSFVLKYEIAEKLADNKENVIFSKNFFNYSIIPFTTGTIYVYVPSLLTNDFFFVKKGYDINMRIVSMLEGDNFNNSWISRISSQSKNYNPMLKCESCFIY